MSDAAARDFRTFGHGRDCDKEARNESPSTTRASEIVQLPACIQKGYRGLCYSNRTTPGSARVECDRSGLQGPA